MARMLVIDDEPSVRQFSRTVLEMSGHQVLEATDAYQGLHQCQVETPDLVICDIFLPGQGGLETIRMLRQINPGLKILAITGGARYGPTTGLMDMADTFGADAVLAKPFSVDQLKRAVNNLLTGGAGPGTANEEQA